MENIDELVGVISYVNIGGSGEQGPPGPPGKDGKGIFLADKDTSWQDIVNAIQSGNVVFYNKGPKNYPTYYQLDNYSGNFMEFIRIGNNQGVITVKAFTKQVTGDDSDVWTYTVPYAEVPSEEGTYVLRATRNGASNPVYEWVLEV